MVRWFPTSPNITYRCATEQTYRACASASATNTYAAAETAALLGTGWVYCGLGVLHRCVALRWLAVQSARPHIVIPTYRSHHV